MYPEEHWFVVWKCEYKWSELSAEPRSDVAELGFYSSQSAKFPISLLRKNCDA